MYALNKEHCKFVCTEYDKIFAPNPVIIFGDSNLVYPYVFASFVDRHLISVSDLLVRSGFSYDTIALDVIEYKNFAFEM